MRSQRRLGGDQVPFLSAWIQRRGVLGEQVVISSPVPCFLFLLSFLLFFPFSFFSPSFLLPGPGLGIQDSEMTQLKALPSERSQSNEGNRAWWPDNYSMVCWVLWLSYLCISNICWMKKEEKHEWMLGHGDRSCSQGGLHRDGGAWAHWEGLVIVTSTC